MASAAAAAAAAAVVTTYPVISGGSWHDSLRPLSQ